MLKRKIFVTCESTKFFIYGKINFFLKELIMKKVPFCWILSTAYLSFSSCIFASNIRETQDLTGTNTVTTKGSDQLPIIMEAEQAIEAICQDLRDSLSEEDASKQQSLATDRKNFEAWENSYPDGPDKQEIAKLASEEIEHRKKGYEKLLEVHNNFINAIKVLSLFAQFRGPLTYSNLGYPPYMTSTRLGLTKREESFSWQWTSSDNILPHGGTNTRMKELQERFPDFRVRATDEALIDNIYILYGTGYGDHMGLTKGYGVTGTLLTDESSNSKYSFNYINNL